MKIKVKQIKVGEYYYFPDNDFNYSAQFKTNIRHERIYQIIDGEFTTKNPDDKYAQQRFIGFKTEREAKDYLIRRIKDRLKSFKEEANEEMLKLLK